MHVVYATDDHYAACSGISMLSLLQKNRDMEELHIYFLDNGITEENKDNLKSIADRYRREITFIDIRDYMEYIDFSLDTHGFNPIVVVRLFITEYLPPKIDRVLYIDGDTLVNGSLRELEELDLTGFYVAAVPELYMPPYMKEKTIGFSKDETYYNAGVLLINLSLWREENKGKEFLAYYAANSERLLYNDQDVINKCCRGKIKTLPQTYNMSANFPYFPYRFVKKLQPAYVFEPKSAYMEMCRQPVIIHYMGDERPWNEGSRNRCVRLYDKYKAMTPWKAEPKVKGKELYMLFYHALNVMTAFAPRLRIMFSDFIGINKYKWFGKN